MPLHRTTPLIAIIALMTLTACETVKGAGRDIRGAGQTVTSEAAKTQAKM